MVEHVTFCEPTEIVTAPGKRALPLEFFQRQLQFYHSQPQPNISEIWDGLKYYQRPLRECLDRRDPSELSEFMAKVFYKDVIGGFEHPNREDSASWYPNSWQATCVNAANALGVLPLINPWQPSGISVYWDALFLAMESVIGFRITHPGGGGMHGIRVKDRFVPLKLLNAVCVFSALKPLRANSILEVGAGAGFLCYYAMTALPGVRYTILDLPIVSIVSSFLLASAFDSEEICFAGDPEPSQGSILFVGTNYDRLERYDLVLNQDSLPEFPLEEADKAIRAISKALVVDGLFLSINQETRVANQLRVFELTQRCPELSLIARAPFWDRTGYVQEQWIKNV